MKRTNLKEFFFVRYADDFKIFCRDYATAKKMFIATKQWLKERLGLDISPDKSKITNVRKNKTEFLGIALFVNKKRNKYVSQSSMTKKAKQSVITNLKNQIKSIQKNGSFEKVNRLNAIILGCHNYYSMATRVNLDFAEINYIVTKSLDNRLKQYMTDKPIKSKTY